MKKGFYAVLAGLTVFFMVLAGCDNTNNLRQNPTTESYIVKFDKNTYDPETGNIINRGTSDATPKNKKVTPPAKHIDKLPVEPVWQNHVFMGWYDTWEDEGGSEFDEYTDVTESITVFARWKEYDPTLCMVTFHCNGGEIEDARKIRVPVTVGNSFSDDGLSLPPDPYWKDYLFMGWYTKQKGGKLFDITMTVEDDMTVYAQWEKMIKGYYVINFETNEDYLNDHSDASPKRKQIRPNSKVGDLPSNPTQAGYIFESWNFQPDGRGGTIREDTVIVEDMLTEPDEITVYAKWQKTNMVTFDKNGGDNEAKPRTITILPSKDTIDALPIPPTRAGYTFEGWYTVKEATGGEKFDAAYKVTKNLTVYARWKGVTYTVTFERNNTDALGTGVTEASPKTAQGSADGTTLPTAPKRTGYTFKEWNTSADGKGTVFTEKTPVTASITVYAIWTTAPGGAKVTVTWDTDLPNPIATKFKVAKGESLTITVDTTGFSVIGWYLDGIIISNQSSGTYTFKSSDVGEHYVTLMAQKDGRGYSAYIEIEVTSEGT